MSGPITVSFTITIDDVVAYLRLLQRTLNRIGVALGLVVIVLGGFVALFAGDLFTGVWTLFIGLLFVVLAGTEFLDRWRVQRSARSLINTKATFTFDDEGIKADTATGGGKVAWDSITAVVHDQRTMVVKRGRIPVVWIPTRAFESEAERD